MDLNQMITAITKALFREKPVNWLKYLKGFINKDRVLPESYYQLFNMDPDKPIPIGMKLLNFGCDKNFIIRPAQILHVASSLLNNDKLRKCYTRIKCLKSLLNVDLNSYFIKKVLLSDEMKEKSETLNEFDLFSSCLYHPDFKHKFELFIDYEELEAHTCMGKFIPILKNRVEECIEF